RSRFLRQQRRLLKKNDLPTPLYNVGELLDVGFDVQDLFVQVTVVIHLKSTLPRRSTTSGNNCLLCCGRGTGLVGTLDPLQDSDPSRRRTSFPAYQIGVFVPDIKSLIADRARTCDRGGTGCGSFD